MTPDLLEIRHASDRYGFLHDLGPLAPGTSSSVFSRSWPPTLTAHIVSNVAATRPRSFRYRVAGADGVERDISARLVVPFGGGRPMVFGVAELGEPLDRSGAVAYDQMRRVLDGFAGELAPQVVLDVLLLLVAEAAAADAVALEHRVGDEVRLLGAVDLADGPDDVADARGTADPSSFPVELLAADGFRLTARGPRRDRAYGWLGDEVFTTARVLLADEDAEVTSADEGPGEAAHVVYVDDDAMSRDLLTEFFRLLRGLELVPVATVEAARTALVEHRPSVVICDAWLGSSSTEPFVTELLTGSRLDPPAVVVLSADANASTIARFRRLGVASYLSKPIDLDRLATVVRDLARNVGADEGNGTRARTTAPSGN